MALAYFFFSSLILVTDWRVLCSLVKAIEVDAGTLSRSFCIPISFINTSKAMDPLKFVASPAIFAFGGLKTVSPSSTT